MLDTQIHRLKDGDVRVEVDERLREQLAQALLGLTVTDIENVLAKAIISGSGLAADAGNLNFAAYLWTSQWKRCIFFAMSKGIHANREKSEVLQGRLDLMVLKVLDAMAPQHGYGIARRIEQVSEQVLQLNEGTAYTSLLRLRRRKWISSEWGASENNRKAKYYSITKCGRKQLAR